MVSTVVPFLALLLATSDSPPPPRPPIPHSPMKSDRMRFPAAEGAWQPGGYEGRIGSPYFYSVPVAGYQFAGHGHGAHCACGRHVHGNHHAHGAYGGYVGQGWTGYDPYSYHFGPGYYRYAEHGHFRFPYYSYRRPWYHPGPPVFNRDTNFAW